MLMLKAFPQKDVFIVPAGFKWGSAALIMFFMWIAGMLNA
jgi:hypothetical protein